MSKTWSCTDPSSLDKNPEKAEELEEANSMKTPPISVVKVAVVELSSEYVALEWLASGRPHITTVIANTSSLNNATTLFNEIPVSATQI
ncbi:unnamed protein product [Nezara viridula]|uniref:Uncharacterized protein n=1 Tax=Nezara viridula TaxID=85310 RepID=A0A9P0MES2_NEZVI|nr:unnamed protein product [Nezara viridula]